MEAAQRANPRWKGVLERLETMPLDPGHDEAL